MLTFNAEIEEQIYGVRVRMRVPKGRRLDPVDDIRVLLNSSPDKMPAYVLLQGGPAKGAAMLVVPIFTDLEVGSFKLGGWMKGSVMRFWMAERLSPDAVVGIDAMVGPEGKWKTIYGEEAA